MSVITFPGLAASSFRWTKVNQALVFRSIFGSQSLDAGVPLWEVELMGVPQYWKDAADTEVLFESLDGFRNQVALWYLPRPVPLGTMRGTMALSAAAARGAVFLQISGGADEAGKTLLKGDLLGLGSLLTQQVVRVVEDCVADGSGTMTVPIGTPLRNAFASGAAVTWDKPKALFRQKSLNPGIEYQAVIGQPWTLSLIEDWRP